MSTHKAIVLFSRTEPPELREIPKPVAGPGSVVVRVLTGGVVSYMRKALTSPELYRLDLPLVIGTNIIARVDSVGPDTVALKPGQLVYCDLLIRGRDNPDAAMLYGFLQGSAPMLMAGEWRNASFAEYAKYPLENVFPLDEERLLGHFNYRIEELNWIATCIVPYGGIKNINVVPGETVIVAPATGGFGGAAVAIALTMGANVVAAGRNKKVLDAMKETLGKTGFLETVVLTGDADADHAALLAATRGKGADAYVDFSPPEAAKNTHFIAALRTLKRRGRVSISGGIQGNIEFPYFEVAMKDISLHGKFMYNREDIVHLIQMAENGIFKLDEKSTGQKIVATFPLEKFNEATEMAAKTQGWGSMVVMTF